MKTVANVAVVMLVVGIGTMIYLNAGLPGLGLFLSMTAAFTAESI